MIKRIRDSLYTTTLAMTPFLLSGCGPDDGTNKRVAVAATTLLCFIFAAAFGQLKAGRAASGRAA
jgi:hypothetical protein